MAALNHNPYWTPSAKAAVGSAAAFIGLFAAFELDLFHSPGLPRSIASVLIIAMLVLGLVLFAWSVLLARNEKPRIDEAAIRPHADLLAGFRWRFLLFRVLVVFGLAPFVEWSMVNGFATPMHFFKALPAIFFFVGLQNLFQILSGTAMGQGVDDELTESFRAQAWGLGFKVTLIAVTVAYIVSYIHDYSWFSVPLGASIPYALALGASAGAVKFAWLERSAAAENG